METEQKRQGMEETEAGGEGVNRLAEKLANPKVNNGILAMHEVKFRIPGDRIAQTCESLPDHQRQSIQWAAGYCRKQNISCEELGLMLKQKNGDTYSESSVYQAFTGRRDQATLEHFCRAVQDLRARVEETQPREGRYVETALSQLITAHCRRAFTKKRITCIFGESQIGKTTALDRYAQEHNHGETTLIRMPTRGSFVDLVEELAFRLSIPIQGNKTTLKRRIIESFDPRTLLIVDECHECLSARFGDAGLAALNFCREIWDRRKCGVVLCGTGKLRRELMTNPVLHQLWRRSMFPLQLPKEPTAEDLNKFAVSYGLKPADAKAIQVEHSYVDAQGKPVSVTLKRKPLEMQAEVIGKSGLGRWLEILRDAEETAEESGGRITWGRVIVAYENWLSMEAA